MIRAAAPRAMSGTRVFILLPEEGRFGPYICPENLDVVECARKALRSDSPRTSDHRLGAKLANYNVWVQLPEIPEKYENKHVLLLVSTEGEKQPTVNVYVVWMKEEAISMDEVRDFACSVYGPSSFDKDSLCSYEDQSASTSERGKMVYYNR